MSRLFLTIAATLALSVAPAVPGFAHALLRASDPATGSTVAGAPKQVSLSFSEAVEPALCRVAVTDAAGRAMPVGSPSGDPHDARRLRLPLGALPPGVYTVTWHAVSVDTHKTEGHFSFTVAP